jgi:hypothetical protein
MKKHFLIMLLLASVLAYAGVYRHDVSPEKYKQLAQQKQFDCVGLALTNCGENYHGRCTFVGGCVLIGKKYVLSAAHLFTKKIIRLDTVYFDKNHKRTDTFLGFEKGGSMAIINQPVAEMQDTDLGNYAFRFKDRLYYPKRWQIYKPYLDSLNLPERVDFCGDLIIAELNDTVAGVAPMALNESYDEQGAVETGVGWGGSGPADRPDDVGVFFEKIAGQNVVDSVLGNNVKGKCSLLSCDFDDPAGKMPNRMGSPKPLPMEWTPSGGDCGGGLFRQVHGRWQLVGITSGCPGSGYDPGAAHTTCYGNISGYIRTVVFNDWIRQTVQGFEAK